MNVLLGAVGTCMAFFGIFMNLYVIIVLLLNKKARTTSEWILLHLGWCGLGASFINLFLISPSIIMARWLTSTGSFCSFVGASVLTLQLLTVWSICALSADRCAAIASPLRYTQLVTAKRVAVFFFFIWVLSIGTMMTAFIVSNDIRHENHAPDDRPFRNDTSYYTNSDSSNHNNSNPSSPIQSSASTTPDLLMSSTRNFIANKTTSESDLQTGVKLGFNASSSPTVANMIFDVDRSAYGDRAESGRSHFEQQSGSSDITNYTSISLDQRYKMNEHVENESLKDVSRNLEYRQAMGLCLPRVYYTSVPSLIWASEWVFVILVAPLCTILICDLVVLSIARKQRHRIVMALYQITLSAQATVVRSKGATPPQLWLNRSIPARSRACRAVLEDLAALVIIHLPLILILVFEMLTDDHHAPLLLHMAGSLSLFFFPSFTAILYGIRARSLRAAYKSYVRKRMTNSTLQHEIQQRLSPVDGGSPRPSSGAKSFR
ncbi:unnamed protein product [Orchesella dallaii]|uniref:G-protein coupled receptors family 1 profile domain-containing protein n=1 Tax=Orchesella dallaii TaxID=48710 RepID=A0ABP1QZF3_9HEXA